MGLGSWSFERENLGGGDIFSGSTPEGSMNVCVVCMVCVCTHHTHEGLHLLLCLILSPYSPTRPWPSPVQTPLGCP